MKSIFIGLLIAAATLSLKAADTTRVTSHNKVVIKTDPSKGYTEYPARVEFPNDTAQYRKAYLYLEFGCAPGLKCGEWDYGNHVYIVKDSIRYELARFITPYGFYWNSSQNWKHGWYYDMTDFSWLLHDSATIIYQHSGYEGNTDRGWTVTMNFTFVNGIPARIPKGLVQMHRLNAPFGNVSNPFSNVVLPKSVQMPSESDMVNFKIIQTGHGMDQQENCAEFCSKKRTVKFDMNTISEENVWRSTCGSNSLYPQAGTWIYDRAGWCPGAPVIPSDILVSVNDKAIHTFSLEMEAYSNTTGGSANYDLTTFAQYFKDNRKQYDAAIDDILSPSVHFDYLRMNPTCGAPLIRVKNMGIDTLRAIEFEYGKQGAALQKIWVPCHIAPFQTQDLVLEAVYNWSGAGNTFVATITKVNDHIDQYTEDNTMYSKITNSLTFPNRVVIVFKSNSAPTENYYTLKDAKGNVIRSKNTFDANTLYRDTVYLENNICYTFEFSDDGPGPSSNPLNKDGLDWWANTADGSGYIQIRSGINNSMLKNFNSDFGTKQVINFQTTFSMDIAPVKLESMQIEAIPNPSLNGTQTTLLVDVASGTGGYSVMVFDMNGKLIQNFTGNDVNSSFILNELSAGIYTATLIQGDRLISKKFLVE